MMSAMRKIPAVVMAVPLVLVLAACGRVQAHVVGAQSDYIAKDHVLVINMSFVPRRITVPAGTTVTWDFDDGATPENVVFDPPLNVASSPENYSGTFKVTFPDPGTYRYVCSLHHNMVGTVVVTPA